MSKRHKILIICGGGIFGAIPAKFLSLLPESETLDKVDLLAGCSIGGILAASYASGKSFMEVSDLFQKYAKDCFKKRFWAKVNPISNPTYDSDSIDSVLRLMVGDKTMGDVRYTYPNLSLIIPALNITDDAYKVFDNITGKDDNVKLADVAAFTSAAPSYFAGREHEGKCLIDGGIIEVAPLLTAITALKGKRGIPFEDMDVLMLGTGYDIDENPLTAKRYNDLSLLGVATEVIVPYVTLSNEMATRYWGNNLGLGSFEYFNPCVTEGKMDDVSLIPSLMDQCDKFRNEFLNSWKIWLSR